MIYFQKASLNHLENKKLSIIYIINTSELKKLFLFLLSIICDDNFLLNNLK
jgi:hypothetical protein